MMIRQRPFRRGQRVKLHDSTIEGGNACLLQHRHT
jgi:hypothetical protein